ADFKLPGWLHLKVRRVDLRARLLLEPGMPQVPHDPDNAPPSIPFTDDADVCAEDGCDILAVAVACGELLVDDRHLCGAFAVGGRQGAARDDWNPERAEVPVRNPLRECHRLLCAGHGRLTANQ